MSWQLYLNIVGLLAMAAGAYWAGFSRSSLLSVRRRRAAVEREIRHQRDARRGEFCGLYRRL